MFVLLYGLVVCACAVVVIVAVIVVAHWVCLFALFSVFSCLVCFNASWLLGLSRLFRCMLGVAVGDYSMQCLFVVLFVFIVVVVVVGWFVCLLCSFYDLVIVLCLFVSSAETYAVRNMYSYCSCD